MVLLLTLTLCLLAGLLAGVLFISSFSERERKRQRLKASWGAIFLVAHFATLEYAFWLAGYNLLSFLPTTLGFYFAAWTIFLMWLLELQRLRWLWVLLAVLALIGTLVLILCERCNWPIQFPPRVKTLSF